VQAAFSQELSQHAVQFSTADGTSRPRGFATSSNRFYRCTHKGEPSPIAMSISCSSRRSGASRLIVPQLKFNFAGDGRCMPLRTVSSPTPTRTAIWMVCTFRTCLGWFRPTLRPCNSELMSIRMAYPHHAARSPYAFGFDAYRLVPALRSNSISETTSISGVSGKLTSMSTIGFAASSIGRKSRTECRLLVNLGGWRLPP